MKSALLWTAMLLILSACEKREQTVDFRVLMGAHTEAWQFMETYEDDNHLRFFKSVFEGNHTLELSKKQKKSLPQVIHWIWIGPHPFPKTSIKHVHSWIKNHPNWKVKFWTDRVQELPHPSMELCLISDFHFEYVESLFEASDNYGEKANLLRYEILYQQGGLYVDHDVKCLKALTPFHNQFDLYCGLEPLQKPVLSSSVVVANNLIGCAPRHPILKKTIENVCAKWAEISRLYPGQDRDSIIYRVTHRSFSPFHDALKTVQIDAPEKNIVFPAAYFNLVDPQFSPYAEHLRDMTWLDSEPEFERNVERQLRSLFKRQSQMLFFTCLILAATLLLLICLIYQLRDVKQRMKRKGR